nr:MAG TPA: hypothetical protein [Bacteriophage sp.]
MVGRYVLLSSAPYRKVLWLSTHYRSCSNHNAESTAAVVHSFRAVNDLHPKYSHRYGLVSSEVSHRIARMVNPLSVHTGHWLAHSGYPLGDRNIKEPRRTASA